MSAQVRYDAVKSIDRMARNADYTLCAGNAYAAQRLPAQPLVGATAGAIDGKTKMRPGIGAISYQMATAA